MFFFIDKTNLLSIDTKSKLFGVLTKNKFLASGFLLGSALRILYFFPGKAVNLYSFVSQ